MKYFEFPLSIPTFAGGAERSQGPDRVIGISPNPGQGKPRSFQFCLAISHRGGNDPMDPSFRPCIKLSHKTECGIVGFVVEETSVREHNKTVAI